MNNCVSDTLIIDKFLLPVAFLFLVLTYNTVKAQDTSYQTDITRRIPAGTPHMNEFSLWGGYSFHSSRGVWGKTDNARLSVFGLRYNRKIVNFHGEMQLKYVVEMNILVHYKVLASSFYRSTTTKINGFGMTPIGFQFSWRKDKAVRPFVKSSAGFMYLENPFPNREGKRFNFTLEFGGGAEIKLTDFSFFIIGYKYHHMSNGEFGQINPGVDSNMFYGGVTIF